MSLFVVGQGRRKSLNPETQYIWVCERVKATLERKSRAG